MVAEHCSSIAIVCFTYRILLRAFYAFWQVPQDTSPVRRNRKDLNFKEKNDFPAAFSTRREKPRKLQDIRSSSEMVPLHPNGNLAEKEGSTRKDASPKSASNVADTLITAWKTGKFQDDYVKAMKRAKEITSGSSSSGISKIFSDRNYSKPWLSRSPFRRSLDREVNDVSLDSHGQNQRSASANPRTNHKSPLNRSRNKPWLSNLSSRSSPERMMDDQSNQGRNHRSGSANLKTSNRSPMSRSNAATMLSPKRTNWTPSLWGPESSKSSPERSRVGRKETTKDPWEGQSLDFVLGSLAEQVRNIHVAMFPLKHFPFSLITASIYSSLVLLGIFLFLQELPSYYQPYVIWRVDD